MICINHKEPLPAMLFPSPSNELMQQASADAPRGQLWSWMQVLPQTIEQCLSRWQIEWTGESLKQGYFGYVLPCRYRDGTHVILKLSPLARESQEQVIALSGWAGCGAAPLLAESFEENGAALLIGGIVPGVAWRPFHDPDGQRIAQCLQKLARVSASSVRGSLPSGLQRLAAQLVANARHLHSLDPLLRRYHDTMIALVDTIGRSQRPQRRSVLLHGDLHAGNLLVGSYDELVAIDPTPALGEPEQDIGDAAAKNDWGQELATRVKQLAEACNADPAKVEAYARLAAWNSGIFHTATGAESPGGIEPDKLLEYASTESA
jgi:streptomycin 6-kinase